MAKKSAQQCLLSAQGWSLVLSHVPTLQDTGREAHVRLQLRLTLSIASIAVPQVLLEPALPTGTARPLCSPRLLLYRRASFLADLPYMAGIQCCSLRPRYRWDSTARLKPMPPTL